MRKIIASITLAIALLASGQTALAAPNNAQKAANNPNVVAYYPLGLHAIPTDPIQYVIGTNMVTQRGNSGQIQAWYTKEDGHGFHSVWNNSKDGTCPDNSVLIVDAYPSWGDYLTPGQDYCVKVNAF
jgi:hypothetical protein